MLEGSVLQFQQLELSFYMLHIFSLLFHVENSLEQVKASNGTILVCVIVYGCYFYHELMIWYTLILGINSVLIDQIS